MKGGCHYADYRVALTVECDPLVHDLLIAAKPSLPQSVTQNYHVVMTGLIFFREKVAAQFGLGAEHRKEAIADRQTAQPFRIAGADQVERNGSESNQTLEHGVLLLPVNEVA